MLVALITLAFIHFCALITPGPDFFLVSQTAVSRSRKEAMLVVAGITAGVMFWASLALMGLNIIFEKMAWLKQGEPYRVCRRVNILRDYPDDKTKLYPRN